MLRKDLALKTFLQLERDNYITYLQKYNYDCEAGAAGIVLLNFGNSWVKHDVLMHSLGVKRNGAPPENLERYFKRRGFAVFGKEGSTVSDLRNELKNDRLCIVLYQGSGTRQEIANLESGHYSVVAGVGNKYIYLLDPGVAEDFGDGVGWHVLTIPAFERRWKDRWKEKGQDVYSNRWMLSIGLKGKNRRK